MANFNPPTGIEVPQDQDWRARPIPANRSLATLFEGIEKTVEGTGKYLYNSAKDDIWNQISNTVDQQVEGQPDVARALDAAGGSRLQQTLKGNPTLSSEYPDLAKMRTAMDQGVMTRSSFWANMTLKAKELRARYPGWNEEISGMFNELTGAHTLEGHLDQAAVSEDRRGEKADAQQKLILSEINKNADYLSVHAKDIYESFLNGSLRYDDPRLTQVLIAAQQFKGRNADLDAQDKRITRDAAAGKVVTGALKQTYSGRVDNIATSILHNTVALGTGPDGKGDIYQVLQSADTSKDPEIGSKIGQWVAIQKASFHKQADELKADYINKGVNPKDLASIDEDMDKRFQVIQDAASHNDYGLISRNLKAFESTVAGRSIAMGKLEPALLNIGALQKISPSAAMAAALNVDPKIYAAAINLGTGTMTGDQVHSTLKDDKQNHSETDQTVGKKFADAVVATVDGIVDGSVHTDAAADFVNKNLSGRSDGFSNYFQQLSSSGKQAFFSKMTTGNFQKAVLKADQAYGGGIAKNYLDWMTGKFGSLPSVITIGDQIKNANASGNRNSFTYSYDSMTHSFTPIPPDAWKDQKISDQVKQDAMKNQQLIISDFSNAINHMALMIKNMGGDPNTKLPEILHNLEIGDPANPKNFAPVAEAIKKAVDIGAKPDTDEDLTNWKQQLEKGEPGAKGSQGANGPKGSSFYQKDTEHDYATGRAGIDIPENRVGQADPKAGGAAIANAFKSVEEDNAEGYTNFSNVVGASPAVQAVESRMWNQESGGNQTDSSGNTITSSAGALGAAQVMPGTAPEAARLAGLPYDPVKLANDKDYNIALGRAYFHKQMMDFGSIPLALAAYNAGPAAVQRAQARANAHGGSWLSYLPEETQNYVNSIAGEQ